MASTFLDEKISSFIQDKFPEFVKADHPVFVEFLKLYYEFLEAAKISLIEVQQTDQFLLENKLTDNYMLNEFDGSRFVFENSVFGAFLKGENVTGQTSGAVVKVLAEDNTNGCLYVEHNRYLQVGEKIVGSDSAARATIGKYQGNPVQNIQQLLEYADVDDTITDFLDRFRNTYLTAIPQTLAPGVSKRNLVKSVRDLYRAKGTKKGHELFFRLMFAETPELFYPTDNLLKVSAGSWTSDTVLRVVATENNPANFIGQTVTQTVDIALEAEAASVNVEGVVQLQEGETTVYQLVLNPDSIIGTFIAGAEVSGIDNTNVDISITATVQSILIGSNVIRGGTGYTTADTVDVTSSTGKDSIISVVNVGAGEIDQIIIDNPGTGYTVGDSLFFNNTNTEGAGASAVVSCIGGALGPEVGDTTAHILQANVGNGSKTISQITTSTLYGAREFSTTGLTSVASKTISNITTTDFIVGATIIGTGIPLTAIVSSIELAGTNNNGSIKISEEVTGTPISISAITQTSGVATVTSTHGITTGSTVTISGCTPTAYNGVKTITRINATSFTFTIASGTSTPAGGTKTFVHHGVTATRSLTHLEEETGQRITSTGLPAGTRIRQISTIGTNNNGTITVTKTATGNSSAVTMPSEYGSFSYEHIVYEDGTESTDAYTGNQIQLEKGSFATTFGRDINNTLSVAPYTANNGHNIPTVFSSEHSEVVNTAVFSKGSGYEVFPIVIPSTFRVKWITTALTTFGNFQAGEQITNASGSSATIATLTRTGVATITSVTGVFNVGEVITGSSSAGFATLTTVTQLGTAATFLAWSTSGIGSISGVEVSQFGTGYATAPAVSVPIKVLLIRKIISDVTQADLTQTTAFSVGDTVIGQSSSARGLITNWDNTRQMITINVTLGTFQLAETLTRGSSQNYAIISQLDQGLLGSTIGTVGITSGKFNDDKGKISESLMRIQDSFYYQDFSYVVRVGAAIADWRSQIKKAVHPAGFAMFGEVSITNKVAARLTVPVSGILTDTPELASLFEAVLTSVIGMRLGTESDGTTLLGSTEIKGTTNHAHGTLKRGYSTTHQIGLTSVLETITRVGTTATVETTGPHGIEAGEQVEISGVTTAGYNGVYEIQTDQIQLESDQLESVTDFLITEDGARITSEEYSADKIKITVPSNLSTPATIGSNGRAKLISPFDNSTRDVTLRSRALITVYPLYGEWNVNQRSRYGLGPRQVNATKYMWAAPPTEYVAQDTAEQNQVLLESSTAFNDELLILEADVLDRVDYAVTAVSGAFIIAGVNKPALTLDGARLYRFDLSDSSVASHPFKLSGTSDGSHSGTDLSRVDYTVTVASGTKLDGSTGNIYVISGVARPTLSLQGARLYRFDLSNSSVSGHPFNFSTTSNGTHAGGSSYTTGVTVVGTPGNAGAYVEILTTNTSSTLHYYCSNHSNMGSSLGITSRVVTGLEYNELSLTEIEFDIQLESGTDNSGASYYLLSEDNEKLGIEIYDIVTSYGTQGSAGAYLEIFTENITQSLYYYCSIHSGMGNSLSVTQIRVGGFVINEAFTSGSDAAYTENSPTRLLDQMAYAYPNMTRRESPETGTDNVAAGGAGVYDTVMNYTNIQIGAHESHVHHRISDFADVRIVDIIKCGREFLEVGSQTNKHEGDNDYEFTIMEDGSYVQMEAGSAGIPSTAKKIWNVPPPSYIRLITA